MRGFVAHFPGFFKDVLGVIIGRVQDFSQAIDHFTVETAMMLMGSGLESFNQLIWYIFYYYISHKHPQCL